MGAPDTVNIPCLMHDTRFCQLDVKMTNNYHVRKSMEIQNLSRCKETGVHNILYVKSKYETEELINP